MHRIPRTVALALALALPSFAAKATIVETASGLSSFDTFIDFSSPTLAVGAVVSNQFAGLTIAPLSGGQVLYDSCGPNNILGITGSANYIDNYGPGCTTNTRDDSFSIKFSTDLKALSFGGDFFFVGNYTLKLLLGGVLKDSQLFTDSPAYDGFITASGTTFDEIQFIENAPGSTQYVQFTNLALSDAAATAVPEPATLALFGAGLAGLGALRRLRKAKSLTE